MCGICGIFGNAREVHSDHMSLVKEMMSRLEHRGPDDWGTVCEPGFAMGHRRLSVIDIEGGSQPMSTPDVRFSLVYNGEVYNYLELRQEMKRKGQHFETFSDTEVLLYLLVQKGKEALADLNGMFAFAFIDRKTGQWLLARDPFGIKPLYYAEVRGEFIFASEIKALLAHPDIKPALNWNALQHYLTFQFCLNGQTLFDGIHSLEPGSFMEGKGNSIERTHRYWDTNYRIDEYHTREYFEDQLLSLLQDSARLQIRSDVPVGAHLSGGIDSSVVASMAAAQFGNSVPVFHGKFEEGTAYDESGYARSMAEWIGAAYHEVVPDAEQFVEAMPAIIYALDEPVAGPGVFPQYFVSRIASEHVKVVLGGQGGDEIFGGYARYLVAYLEQALKGAIYETQEEGKHIVTLDSIIPNLPILQQYRPLMQHFWKDGLFEEMDVRYFRLIDRSPNVRSLLTQDALHKFSREEVFLDFQSVFNHPDTHSYVNKMTHFDQKTLLPALLHVEDRVSMMVSLESRVPLLDTRIVDLITTMPPPMKFHGGRTKHILKQAVKDLLPRAVWTRKDKMGFPVPLHEWMAKGPVRDFVYDVLLSKVSKERGLFDIVALEKLFDREGRFGRELWGALCLELWHQRFIDGI